MNQLESMPDQGNPTREVYRDNKVLHTDLTSLGLNTLETRLAFLKEYGLNTFEIVRDKKDGKPLEITVWEDPTKKHVLFYAKID